jgi:transcriptional regulator with XRE-family HTH domain
VNILGKRIKRERENKGLSQIELAKLLKISNTTLSQYETGQRIPGDEIKIKLADIFECTLDYLLGRTDIRTPIETIAAHRSDDPMSELPEEARRSLEEFKEYILEKYGIEQNPNILHLYRGKNKRSKNGSA